MLSQFAFDLYQNPNKVFDMEWSWKLEHCCKLEQSRKFELNWKLESDTNLEVGTKLEVLTKWEVGNCITNIGQYNSTVSQTEDNISQLYHKQRTIYPNCITNRGQYYSTVSQT